MNLKNIKLVIDNQQQKELHTILANAHRITQAGALNTELYSIKALMHAIDNDLIRTPFKGDKFYALTVKGEVMLATFETEDRSVRSRNNNVFHYSSYWGTWSRILWHSSDIKLQKRIGFNVRSSSVIEIDLTAVNPMHETDWLNKTQHGNVRCHSTSFDPKDKIVGTLPGYVVDMMNKNLPASVVDKLLHADYLPYLDFEQGRKICNGGFKVNDAFKQCISMQQYLCGLDAGPGVFESDVQEAYDALKADLDRKINSLKI